MKKALLFLSFLLVGAMSAYADEGMWLPSLISQRIGDMQAKGFRLTAEDVYSVNQASLKDAVVLFGSGCTGELVSDEGLLLTNHHCGYSYIQRHSSVEHDYLKDGFWAMNRSEELPNKGLTVSFLERMEDVTDQVLAGYVPSMTEAQRDSVVRANSKQIIADNADADKGLTADVEALYYGNQYFLFVFRVYRDVRLVGAPPSSIGNSRCSASMPTKTTTPPTILRTTSRITRRDSSKSPAQASRKAISPSSMAALAARRNT